MKVVLGSLLGLVGANAFLHKHVIETRDKFDSFHKIMQHRFEPVDTLDFRRRMVVVMDCGSILKKNECVSHEHCVYRRGECNSKCFVQNENGCRKMQKYCEMDEGKCVPKKDSEDMESKDMESKDMESKDMESKDMESKDMESKDKESSDEGIRDAEDLLIRVVVGCEKHNDVRMGFMAFEVKFTEECQRDPGGGKGSFMMKCSGKEDGSMILMSFKEGGCRGEVEKLVIGNDQCTMVRDEELDIEIPVLYHWDWKVTKKCGVPSDPWEEWPAIDAPVDDSKDDSKDDGKIEKCGLELLEHLGALIGCGFGNWPVEGMEQEELCRMVGDEMFKNEGKRCDYTHDVNKCDDFEGLICQYVPPGACFEDQECDQNGGVWRKCIGRDCPKVDYGWIIPPGHGGSGSGGMMMCPFECHMDDPMCPCRMGGPCDGMTARDNPEFYNGGRCVRDAMRYCCQENPEDEACWEMPFDCGGSGSGHGSGSGDDGECPFHCRMWPEEHQEHCPCTWIMDPGHVCYGIHEADMKDPRPYNEGKCWPTIQQYCCDAYDKDPTCEDLAQMEWIDPEKCSSRDSSEENPEDMDHMVGIGYALNCDSKDVKDVRRDVIYLMKTTQCQLDPTRETGSVRIRCDSDDEGARAIRWTAYADMGCEDTIADAKFPIGRAKCYVHPFDGIDDMISIEKFNWEFFCGVSTVDNKGNEVPPFVIGVNGCQDNGMFEHMIEYQAVRTEECQKNTNEKKGDEYLKITCGKEDELIVGTFADKDCTKYKDEGEGDMTVINRQCNKEDPEEEYGSMVTFDWQDFCKKEGDDEAKECKTFEGAKLCKNTDYCDFKNNKCQNKKCKKFKKKGVEACNAVPHCTAKFTKAKPAKKPGKRDKPARFKTCAEKKAKD